MVTRDFGIKYCCIFRFMAGITRLLYRLGITVLFVLLTIPLASTAQSRPSELYPQSELKLNFRFLTRQSGLPSQVCYDAVQDFRGYIWIGTDNGLARYDGRNFTTFKAKAGDPFSIVDNSVHCLLQTRDSMLWIGTLAGISMYNPFTGTFRNFPYDPKNKDGFPGEMANNMFEDHKGNLWVGTNSGLILVNRENHKFTRYSYRTTDNQAKRGFQFDLIQGIGERPGDTTSLWITSYGGILEVNSKTFKIKKVWGFELSFGRGFTCMFIDRQGMIWTGGWGIALSCLDPATGKWSRYFPEKLPLGNILCITPDQQNRLLIGTANQGAAMFDPVRREFQLISGEDPGVGSDEHKGILKISQFNPSHEIWILSNDIAVEDKSFHSFQYVTVPYTADISCVYHDEKESLIYAGAIWCNGFYIYNESRKNWKEIRPDIHVGSHLLCVRRMLQDSKGVLWVGTRQGLMTLDKDKSKLHFVGNINGKSLNVSDSVVNTIFEDKKGNLWVGTLCEGVYRINPDRADVTFFRTRETKDHKKESWQPVKAIQEDYLGNIWIGTADGITVYNPIKNTFNRSVDDSLRSYRPSNRIIHSIVEDDQRRLWISIDHFGLMCVTITKEGKYKLSMYSTDDLGLENSIITHLYPDQKGGIWINNLNLVHFDPYTFSLRTFTEYNGLHYRMGDNVRPYADHSGTLFLPADQGFETTSVIPDPGSSAIREVVIEQVLIKGKRIPFGSNNSALHMKLDPDQNDLAFVFSAICFQNTGMINYSYFLKGYDKDWNICIANREAKYTNLPPGEYVFMVRASCQGLNNVKEARLAFTIPPHFWETWWFILLVVLLILTLLYNIYRYRLEQMLKLERLRTRIATDLHDEVASTLSGISIMSEILGKEVKENRSARMISEIGNKSMKMMEMIDDIIWVVKPVNDRFQNLGLRIMEFATPLFESKDISYSFELDEKLSGLNLPMEQRRNIYLIAKEAINNMIKYSGCSHASIVFSGKEHDLTMEIADNGCGFDPALPTSRNGIKNMRLRASQIRAEIQILSAPGEGTRIILTSKMN